jgi:hypothetical protein
VFDIQLDGLNDEIKFIGAVDFPGDAVVFAWRDGLGFGEVVQPIDSWRRVISHDEHATGTAFRPVIFDASKEISVTETIELFRIDRQDTKSAFEKLFHQRAMRHLDGDGQRLCKMGSQTR